MNNIDTQKMNPSSPDEINSFFMLVFLMEDREWREIMRPGVTGLL